MTTLLGLVAWLLLPLFGLWTWRIDFVRRLDAAARIAIAAAAGALVTGVVMFTMSILGIRWSHTTLFLILGIIAVAGIVAVARTRAESREVRSRNIVADIAIVLLLVLAAYAAVDARESSGDLHYFWGPKGVRFARAGGIDADFLRNRDFYSMHPDYPPLVPLLYAWSMVVSRRFAWWAAVLSGPLLLAGIAAVVRALGGKGALTVLTVVTLAQAMLVGYAAGAADPLLVFFEAIALAALAFVEDPRAQTTLAAIGLAGAVWTKIEGTTFAIAVIVALVSVRPREWKRAAIMAAPAAALVAAWTLYISVAGVLDMYAAAGRFPIHPEVLPRTLGLMGSAASYEAFWIPWIAPLLFVATGDWRRAAFPLLVAALTILAAIYFYIHAGDPAWWIASSAPRVLMTPVLALDIAAIASTRSRSSPQVEPAAA